MTFPTASRARRVARKTFLAILIASILVTPLLAKPARGSLATEIDSMLARV